MAISPRGAELLVVSYGNLTELENPLWALPLPSGPPRRLGDLMVNDATWTPDGQQIVYSKGHALCVAKTDGTHSRQLVTLPEMSHAYWFSWEPGGSRLRFTLSNYENPSSSLWEVALNGTDLHPLLPDWSRSAAECCGQWSRDGKYFIFTSISFGYLMGPIWVRQEKKAHFWPSRQAPLQLTTGPLSFGPAVPSQEGKKLFVVGSIARGELVRYDSKTQHFDPYLSGISAGMVDFSRDGQWVAYVTYPELALWRSKVDGSQRQQLSFPPLQACLPRWSPDNRRIAFSNVAMGKPYKIYLVSAEGGVPQPLLPETPESYEASPNWFPDGKRLAFSYWKPSGKAVLQVIELQTQQVSTVPGSEGWMMPRLSPDGRYLAACPFSEQVRTLRLYDFTTGKWAHLVDDVPVSFPNWSRDGQYLYFDSAFSKQPALYRVRIRDRKLEPLMSLKDVRLTGRAFPHGSWSSLAPDDSPLLLRDVGSEELYALDWEVP